MRKERVIQVRLSYDEEKAWQDYAILRQMTLSQMVRSAVATFLTAGRNTVVVPAAPEPAYVDELRRADRAGEPVRGTAGLEGKFGAEAAAVKERQSAELAAAAERVVANPKIHDNWPDDPIEE